METQLVRYVKNRRGEKVGCVIAKSFPGLKEIYVSGSLCHTKVERFDKETALALAEERAIATAFHGRACPLPHSLTNEVYEMVDRAHRYFKERPVVMPVIKTATSSKQPTVYEQIMKHFTPAIYGYDTNGVGIHD